jgi:methylmalonyl-CoA/ethylmalonyl-CoA epimerase
LGSSQARSWRPLVLRTEATTGRGVPELAAAIEQFKAATSETRLARRRTRLRWGLRGVLNRLFMHHVETRVLDPEALDRHVDRLSRREVDPYSAAAEILRRAGVSATPAPIDHVGVATRDAAPIVEFLRDVFGLECDSPEDLGLHRVRFVDTGDCKIEFVEPLAAEAPVARFLDAHGPGVHHVCLRVKDIEASLADLIARGVRVVDRSPRPGAHGSRIAFIHPSSAGGLLIELKQLAEDQHMSGV